MYARRVLILVIVQLNVLIHINIWPLRLRHVAPLNRPKVCYMIRQTGHFINLKNTCILKIVMFIYLFDSLIKPIM